MLRIKESVVSPRYPTMKKPAALIPAATQASTAARAWAGAMHLLEQRLVDMRDAAEAFPREWQVLLLDRLSQLECALVVECEQVVRHPYVVIAEIGDLTHLRHHRLDRAGAEQVAEDRLVAEVAPERAAPGGHEGRGRVLPVLAPVVDVLGVGDVAAIRQREVRHVLAADTCRRAHDLAVASEDEAGNFFEAPVVEMLHDLDDGLLALSYRDEVELVDEGVRLTGGVRAADHGQRLVADLLRE